MIFGTLADGDVPSFPTQTFPKRASPEEEGYRKSSGRRTPGTGDGL